MSLAARVPAAPSPTLAAPHPRSAGVRPETPAPALALPAAHRTLPAAGRGRGPRSTAPGRGLASGARRRGVRGLRSARRDAGGARACVPRAGRAAGSAHDRAPLQVLRLDPAAPVWAAKRRVLCALNHSLQDALNYGLFQPPSRGRAGKFLDEAALQEYPPNLDSTLPGGEQRPGTGRAPELQRARRRGARTRGVSAYGAKVRSEPRAGARSAARAAGCERA